MNSSYKNYVFEVLTKTNNFQTFVQITKEKSGTSCLSQNFFSNAFSVEAFGLFGVRSNFFPGFAIFFQVFAQKPLVFPGFPGVTLFFQVFQVRWEPCTNTEIWSQSNQLQNSSPPFSWHRMSEEWRSTRSSADACRQRSPSESGCVAGWSDPRILLTASRPVTLQRTASYISLLIWNTPTIEVPTKFSRGTPRQYCFSRKGSWSDDQRHIYSHICPARKICTRSAPIFRLR